MEQIFLSDFTLPFKTVYVVFPLLEVLIFISTFYIEKHVNMFLYGFELYFLFDITSHISVL